VSITETRARIASTLTSVLPDVRVHPHRPAVCRVNDGWLVLRSVEAMTFQTCQATFDVLVLLSTDEQAAAETFDRVAVTLIDAIGDFLGTPSTVVPQSLNIGDSQMFCCAATLLIEVS
jgi:hypothetical protein